MRVIIAAAGGDGKWGGHLGMPRHMVQVAGEALLQRTIRQAVAFTQDVHVTTPDDDRYRVVGAYRHVREPGASEYESTRDLWSEDGRTVLLLGDVYFTDRAMATIARDTRRGYRVYGRKGASRVTGTPYGEIFAVSWWPEHHVAMDRHLATVHDLRAAGTITRPPGWMLLRAWQGTPLGRHIVKRRFFTAVDDLTDDIDKPVDYARHPAMGGAKQPGGHMCVREPFKTLDEVTGISNGAVLDLGELRSLHTIQVIVTGGPDECSVGIQISPDGVNNWMYIDTTDYAPLDPWNRIRTATGVGRYVHARVYGLAGGASPTVTAYIASA